MADIALKTRVLLWGRAAARCAFPECHKELVHDATETDDESLIGDIAHIVAESEDGPRGKSTLSEEERAKYSNLVLMCKNHHKVIDDQPYEWTVNKLTVLQKAHEEIVRDRMSAPEIQRIAANEAYASIVDEWAQRTDLEHWEAWTSWLLGADGPSQTIEFINALRDIVPWLLGRVWPDGNERLENAFLNFRLVLNDLLLVFGEHATKGPDDCYHTERFYRIKEWNPKRYHELVDHYETHVDLVNDLVLELTRAANFICDIVRATLEPSYRLKEGVLLVTAGPYGDMRFHTFRTEYREQEQTEVPYQGIAKFKVERFTRDHTFAPKPSSDSVE